MATNIALFAVSKGITAPAPGWVTYLTIVISFTSMLVALFTFLRAGVRIKLRVVYAYHDKISADSGKGEQGKVQSVVRLRAINGRRGEIDIMEFFLIPPRDSLAPRVRLGSQDILKGPTLRYRMPGLSTEYWEVNASPAFRTFESRSKRTDKEYRYYRNADPTAFFRFAVQLGDGKLVRSNRILLAQFKSLGTDKAWLLGRRVKYVSVYPESDFDGS